MQAFMGEDVFLDTDAARELYHTWAEPLPIVDYHSHIDPREIAADRRWDNLAQLWLGGDHYKWRLERSNGEAEAAVTGGASDREKFQAFVRALERAPGNPVYHWTHLELRRYFGYRGALNRSTADEVWELSRERLKTLSAREILRQSRVELLATTDDPCDSLGVHRALAADPQVPCRVIPTFRPDWALDPTGAAFRDKLAALEAAAGIRIDSLKTFFDALERQMDRFAAAGCRSGDQSMASVPRERPGAPDPRSTFQTLLSGGGADEDALERYRWEVLTFLGGAYARRGWVMQIHDGVLRGVNSRCKLELGPDTGFDCMGSGSAPEDLLRFLDALDRQDALPKTILYSLVPGRDVFLETAAGCFARAGTAGKVLHGAAWWFNDTAGGIRRHLTALAEGGLLGNHVGMLTDSRSFLSYARHEYFRRILCGLLGQWVEQGTCPDDRQWLGGLVRDVCYGNVKRYFELS